MISDQKASDARPRALVWTTVEVLVLERLPEGVERAGPDVAEHDAQSAAEGERCPSFRGRVGLVRWCGRSARPLPVLHRARHRRRTGRRPSRRRGAIGGRVRSAGRSGGGGASCHHVPRSQLGDDDDDAATGVRARGTDVLEGGGDRAIAPVLDLQGRPPEVEPHPRLGEARASPSSSATWTARTSRCSRDAASPSAGRIRRSMRSTRTSPRSGRSVCGSRRVTSSNRCTLAFHPLVECRRSEERRPDVKITSRTASAGLQGQVRGADEDTEVFAFRRVPSSVVDDVGLRRARRGPSIGPSGRVTDTGPTIVWNGDVLRGPALRRFSEHLERQPASGA